MPTTRPFAPSPPRPLARCSMPAGVGAGMQVLDEATGPGYVAAAAAARGADVIAVDFAAAMVAEARQRHPGLDVRQADVESLPFADASFDAVVMNFGALHLAQPDLAFAEAYRVLRPGGGFAFTVWAPPQVSAGYDMVLRAIHAHGTTNVPLPPGPPFFRFGDPAESTRSLQAVGFTDVQAVVLPLVWELPHPEAMLEVMHRATVRIGRAAPGAIPSRVRRDSCRGYGGGGHLRHRCRDRRADGRDTDLRPQASTIAISRAARRWKWLLAFFNRLGRYRNQVLHLVMTPSARADGWRER